MHFWYLSKVLNIVKWEEIDKMDEMDMTTIQNWNMDDWMHCHFHAQSDESMKADFFSKDPPSNSFAKEAFIRTSKLYSRQKRPLPQAKMFNSSYHERNFTGNQLLDASIRLSPLYPSVTNDLLVSIVMSFPDFALLKHSSPSFGF